MPSLKKTKRINVRTTPEQIRRWRKWATECSLTLPNWIRLTLDNQNGKNPR
jgi:hypothetical protein